MYAARFAVAILVASSLPWASAAAEDAPLLRSAKLRALQQRVNAGDLTAEPKFFSGLETPLVEAVEGNRRAALVTFIWHGDSTTKSVVVSGGRPKSDWDLALEKLRGTELWYRTEELPSDSRFMYWLTPNAPAEKTDRVEDFLDAHAPASVTDPLNPHALDGESYVVLPDALPFPYQPVVPSPARGSVVDASIASATLEGSVIALKVYLPPEGSRRSNPWLAIAFDDGFEDMGTVLDDLIAIGKIPPLVMVGVVNRPNSRRRDLGYSDEFAAFVVKELLPWAERTYHTSSLPSQRIIAGESRGAGMAAYVALQYPRAFGNVLCLSTAIENEPGYLPPTRFWLRNDDGWIIRRFLEKPRQPLRFFIGVGRFDTSLWTDRLVNNRRFRDMLRGKGYRVHYAEANGGHDELLFQWGYAEGLAAVTARGTERTPGQPRPDHSLHRSISDSSRRTADGRN